MPRTRPGGVVLADWELARLAEREATIVTARCMWCAWSATDTVLTTREAYAQHRTTEHPDVVVRKQVRRKRLFGQMSTTSDLTDNIAKTREQGGAQWASDAE
jgi:hypothetical protein